MQLIALTFVRRGDVCAMKWSDINFLTKQWIFRPQKAGSREDMTDLVTPLAPQAMAILERMKANEKYVDLRVMQLSDILALVMLIYEIEV